MHAHRRRRTHLDLGSRFPVHAHPNSAVARQLFPRNARAPAALPGYPTCHCYFLFRIPSSPGRSAHSAPTSFLLRLSDRHGSINHGPTSLQPALKTSALPSVEWLGRSRMYDPRREEKRWQRCDQTDRGDDSTRLKAADNSPTDAHHDECFVRCA